MAIGRRPSRQQFDLLRRSRPCQADKEANETNYLHLMALALAYCNVSREVFAIVTGGVIDRICAGGNQGYEMNVVRLKPP
jgi:hypothetical protein